MGLKSLAIGLFTRATSLVPMDTASALSGIATAVENFLSTASGYVYLVAAVAIFGAGLALIVSSERTRASIKGTMIMIIVGSLICMSATALAQEICSMLSGGI